MAMGQGVESGGGWGGGQGGDQLTNRDYCGLGKDVRNAAVLSWGSVDRGFKEIYINNISSTSATRSILIKCKL